MTDTLTILHTDDAEFRKDVEGHSSKPVMRVGIPYLMGSKSVEVSSLDDDFDLVTDVNFFLLFDVLAQNQTFRLRNWFRSKRTVSRWPRKDGPHTKKPPLERLCIEKCSRSLLGIRFSPISRHYRLSNMLARFASASLSEIKP